MVMTSRYFYVYPMFISCLPVRPPSSAGVDNNYNRVSGLAMHPVNDHNQRKGREEDRKGGGTTVAGARVLLPIFLLLLLPLAPLLIH